ncbi:sigma factor [Dictyobacter vulcani]|uniref:sigma factor n=1 Tax=Dictyobacter vulcani TaxID=2607529 RepID=UPI0018E9FC20|nr:sigma factor [Dictyobacter vulcani]
MTMGNSQEDVTTSIFSQYKTLLFSIAYRMLGSSSDAEDMVQEAFVRWLQTNQDEVASPKAYLSTVVVRLCIDHARSARVQREVYTGPWLPTDAIPNSSRAWSRTALQRPLSRTLRERGPGRVALLCVPGHAGETGTAGASGVSAARYL